MNKNTAGYIAVIVLLSITSVFSIGLFHRQRVDHDILDVRSFPYSFGEWRGEELEITEDEYRILETRNLISREYINNAGKKMYLFIVYSETNRSVFHPPEVCYIGSGVNITDKAPENIEINGRAFTANKLYTEKDSYNNLALYLYKAGNLYTDNYVLQQAAFAFNQLLARRRGGATIRVSTPLEGDEEAALASLKGFMKETIKILEEL
jgi:EpsI family protein